MAPRKLALLDNPVVRPANAPSTAPDSDSAVARRHRDDIVNAATDIIAGEAVAIQHVDPNLTLEGLRLIWGRNAWPEATAAACVEQENKS